jgi:GT2 family glycosyltransferase
MSDPDVSIVIVNYNGSTFIERSIRSALEQRVPAEVIVVDNGSTDGSLELLNALSGIRVVSSDRNLGFAGGANLGARHARGAFLAFLNSDAIAAPDWLATLLPWMLGAKLDLVSSAVSCGGDLWFSGGLWLPALGAALHAQRPLARCAWLSGCALIARRAAWEQLGGFDEGFFLYFEDVDLCLSARRQGLRLGLHPQPLVRHDTPGSSAKSLGFEKLIMGYRSKGRLIAKHVPGLLLPSTFAFQFSISPLTQGVRLDRLPSIWRSFIEGFRSAR